MRTPSVYYDLVNYELVTCEYIISHSRGNVNRKYLVGTSLRFLLTEKDVQKNTHPAFCLLTAERMFDIIWYTYTQNRRSSLYYENRKVHEGCTVQSKWACLANTYSITIRSNRFDFFLRLFQNRFHFIEKYDAVTSSYHKERCEKCVKTLKKRPNR